MQQHASTALPIEWSPTLDIPMRHVNLSETLSSIQRGIDQAAKGEGKDLDPRGLPTADNE